MGELAEYILSDLHRGNFNIYREDLFRNRFLEGMRGVGILPKQMVYRRLCDLIRGTFDAAVNVYDHANRNPDEKKQISSRMIIKPGTKSLVVSVEDDGNGIAARHALDSSIYEEPFEVEFGKVKKATLPRESVKLKAKDCHTYPSAGYGFLYIAAVARHGTVDLWSGRVRAKAVCGKDDVWWECSPEPQPFLQGTRVVFEVPISSKLDSEWSYQI